MSIGEPPVLIAAAAVANAVHDALGVRIYDLPNLCLCVCSLTT